VRDVVTQDGSSCTVRQHLGNARSSTTVPRSGPARCDAGGVRDDFLGTEPGFLAISIFIPTLIVALHSKWNDLHIPWHCVFPFALLYFRSVLPGNGTRYVSSVQVDR
jgi:hypothetical protein